MSASGWVGSLGAVVVAGLAVSGHATAQDFGGDNDRARAQVESQQEFRGGRGRGDFGGGNGGRADWRGNDRRDRYDGRDRHDHWGRGWNGGFGWGWSPRPQVVYAPPPRYSFNYNRGYYRHDHFDAVDAIALGLFGAVIISALSDNERGYHESAYNSAMRAPVGQNIVWNDNATNGTVRVTRDGYAGNKYCREFQQTITINGQSQDAWGISCQEPDGSWRIQPQN